MSNTPAQFRPGTAMSGMIFGVRVKILIVMVKLENLINFYSDPGHFSFMPVQRCLEFN